MRRVASKLWGLLLNRSRRRPAPRPGRQPLELETLEDRCLLSATASGAVTGTAYVDFNGNHVLDLQDFALPGVTVSLLGTTTQGSAVNATATTDARGDFTFQNVQAGAYQLGYATVPGLLGGPPSLNNSSAPAGVTVVSNLTVVGGETTTQSLGFLGLGASFISLRQFLSTSTPAGDGLPAAGTGQAVVSPRENNAPVLAKPISDVTGIENGSNVVNLAGFFTDPDITNTTVRFDTSAGPVNVQLFDNQAPQTVANFLDYVKAGNYNNSIFHRLVQNFVLQGGGFSLGQNPTSLTPIPTLPAVPNEFGASNVPGTLAMALTGSNTNSATDEFFFNLANNASALDPQDFTVFGKIVGTADMQVLNTLAQSTPTNEGGDFSEIPLKNFTGSSFPAGATASNFDVVKDVAIVSQNESLTYSVVSNSNPNLVAPTLKDNYLSLNYAPGQTGSATIAVRATDTFGASVVTSFNVNVIAPAPVVNSATIAPDNAAATTALTANPIGSSASGDTVAFGYQWLQNGMAIAGATSQALNLTTTPGLAVAAGDQFAVQVTPIDGTVTGAPFTSNAVTIATTAPITLSHPTVDTLAIAPNNPSNTTTLTALPTSKDGTAVTFSYQWLQNGTPLGVTSQVLHLTTLSVNAGDKFTVKVTPSDATGAGPLFTSNPVTISAAFPTITVAAPVVNSATIAPDNPSATTVLTAMPTGSDSGGNTVAFSYQWLQNEVAIPGATTATLNLTTQVSAVNANDVFTVQVTPNNGTLNGLVFRKKATVKTVNPTTVVT